MGLLTQLAPGAEEQDALDPSGTDKEIGQGDCDAGFAGAGRLHNQRLAVLVGEVLRDALDRLDLINAIEQCSR